MTQLYLARHGETVWNSANRYSGTTDVALSTRGRTQAETLAAWARGAQLDAVWSSTASRARQTAELSATASSIVHHENTDLMELDFGDAEGLTPAEISDRWPGVFEAFVADPVGSHMPNGEHPEAAASRFCDVIWDIAEQMAESRVLVICHSTALRLGLCRLLGLPLNRYRHVFPLVHNCALTELSVNAGAVSLMQFNVPTDRNMLGMSPPGLGSDRKNM